MGSGIIKNPHKPQIRKQCLFHRAAREETSHKWSRRRARVEISFVCAVSVCVGNEIHVVSLFAHIARAKLHAGDPPL